MAVVRGHDTCWPALLSAPAPATPSSRTAFLQALCLFADVVNEGVRVDGHKGVGEPYS